MSEKLLEQTMLKCLTRYQQLIIQQLSDNELVGEFLTGEVEPNVRLLCQLRTIIFLIKTAHLLGENNINIAEKLYLQTEAHYLEHDKWLQQLNNKHEANLYSYAFVILAQSYLFQATYNPLYAIALAETFSLVEGKFQGLDIFKPLSDLDCLEQNSAMHLFEALTFAYYQADAIYMKDAINQLQQLVIKHFWQAEKQLLAEKISATGQVLTYEVGHWFEWVSLWWRVEQKKAKTVIDIEAFYKAAKEHATFTEHSLVCNEMDASFQPLDTKQIRIWPNLEYLRAKAFIEQQLPSKELTDFIAYFFDERGLPKEYITQQPVQAVKSTTGYHIAESFVDILTIVSEK